jgi:DNA-binding response OmpR family regulator
MLRVNRNVGGPPMRYPVDRLTRPLILVVEDDPDVLTLMETALGAEGYRVATAEDGEAALASARRERPDLIVLDLMMPRMNALQFRAEQRRDPQLSGVPVICLSALSHAQTVALELGTDDCLGKPIDFDRLRELIRKHLAGPR